MVRMKRIYDTPGRGDGLRVLVMRLWPRGVRKSAVDLWLKELGADVENIKAWKAGRLDWPEMKRRYLAGLARPAPAAALARLRGLARRRTVTLLCACEDEARCHRGILKSALRRAAARRGSGAERGPSDLPRRRGAGPAARRPRC
jgi:uncharacterized protein YeaO (DUF488 family)